MLEQKNVDIGQISIDKESIKTGKFDIVNNTHTNSYLY